MQKYVQKFDELGFLSAILCVFVIFIHIASKGLINLEKLSFSHETMFFFSRSCQFVVQGFIFLSALKICMKYKDKPFGISEYFSFVKNRIKVIFVPYCIWVMVYYITFCLLGYFNFNFFEYLRFVFIGDLSAQFYFIIIIMQFYLLFPLWLYYAKKIRPWIGIVISLFITFIFVYYFYDFLYYSSNGRLDFLYNDRIFTSYFSFLIMGCYAGIYYEKFKNLITKYKNIVVMLFFIILAFNTKVSYDGFIGQNKYWIFGISHMAYCTIAIFFWYWFCTLFTGVKNRFTRLLNIINKGSYYTYLSHCLIIIILDEILRSLGIFSIKTSFIINFAVVYFVSIVTSYAYTLLKARIKNTQSDKIKTAV